MLLPAVASLAVSQGPERACSAPSKLRGLQEGTHGGFEYRRGERWASYRGQDPEVISAQVSELGHIHLPHGGQSEPKRLFHDSGGREAAG